jgi:hypothetical protein
MLDLIQQPRGNRMRLPDREAETREIIFQPMDEHQPTTGERLTSKTKVEVIKEAERIEESLLYSSKGHFAAAHFWGNFHFWIGIPIVLLSAIAGAAALVPFDPWHLVAGSLSILVAAMSAVATFLNANEKVGAHLKAGNSYDTLMNNVRIFRTIECWTDESDQVLTERLKHFSEKKNNLNHTSPQIPIGAYRTAKKGRLNHKEAK